MYMKPLAPLLRFAAATCFTAFALVALPAPLFAAEPKAQGDNQKPSFLRDVAPILATRCIGCHGDKKAEGDYRLHTFAMLTSPGATDEKPLVAGKPEESELFKRLVEADPELRMPQLDDALSAAEVETVRRWIAAGASFDGAEPNRPFRPQMPPRTHPRAPAVYPHAAPVFAAAFSPDGKTLATGGLHEVLLWDAEKGGLVQRIAGLPLRIQAIAYDKQGERLLVAGGTPGEYGEVCVVDPKNPQADRRVMAVSDDLFLDAVWSGHEKWIAACGADRAVRMVDVQSGKRLWESTLHADWVGGVSFSSDDRFLASAARDCTVKILTAETGKLFTTFNGHQMELGPEAGRFEATDVLFAPEGPRAYSVGAGRSIRVWEPEKVAAESGDARDMEERFGKGAHTLFWKHDSQRPGLKLACGGGFLFLATGDGPVKQYSAEDGKLLKEWTGLPGWTYALAVHAPAGRLAAGGRDGVVKVWNLASGECTLTFTASPLAAAPSRR